jgi:hypothetical protein
MRAFSGRNEGTRQQCTYKQHTSAYVSILAGRRAHVSIRHNKFVCVCVCEYPRLAQRQPLLDEYGSVRLFHGDLGVLSHCMDVCLVSKEHCLHRVVPARSLSRFSQCYVGLVSAVCLICYGLVHASVIAPHASRPRPAHHRRERARARARSRERERARARERSSQDRDRKMEREREKARAPSDSDGRYGV